jgi:chromosome segregation ATPase
MQLKRLEITGFKSFAKKSELAFTSPITSVVGPNGSGKSNVVESIRFVLGEQSMKSLRGKLGADLIFKGSKALPKQSRAYVTITFDNSNRVFTMANSSGGESLKLDYDEVSISREVYPDGVNRYLINGTEVRLKDVLELLASVNIGSSGHHIISQGEADRILNASAKERRAMIEDALGLKVYQYRIRESERKLEKTQENIKEAETLRREIVPHLSFLKKQVEKYEKAEYMRGELEGLYAEYLKKEEVYITHEKHSISTEKKAIEEKLGVVSSELAAQKETTREKSASEAELESIDEKVRSINSLKDDVSRKLGRIEGMIELEEKRHKKLTTESETEGRPIPAKEIEHFLEKILQSIDAIAGKESIAEISPIIERIRIMIVGFVPKGKDAPQTNFDESELVAMRESHHALLAEVSRLSSEERTLRDKAVALKVAIEKEKQGEREQDQARFERILKKQELENALALVTAKESLIEAINAAFVEEVREGNGFIGAKVLAYKDFAIPHADETEPRAAQEERKRAIERIKIKLEDIGVGGGDDIMKEYRDVSERNEFLLKEITDLRQTIESLESLIRELKEHLDATFREGLEKINKQFQIFFALMFGGGTAMLTVSVPKKKMLDDEEIADEPIDEEQFESGIEIGISLPHKKVKELTMLSGGERSLTSIALLFAISQVNPPPFLVLDETDAALDEANSRKYGDMLENLSKYSQLIVVTHNRETMSRANVLYGVTVGADGGSKLLSIKFDEAAAIAK